MNPEGLLRYWENCHHRLEDDLRSRFLERVEVSRLLDLPTPVVMEAVAEHQKLQDALEAAENAMVVLAEKMAKSVDRGSEELNDISDETGTYRCVDCQAWLPLHEFEYQFNGETKVARRCAICRETRRRGSRRWRC